MSDNTEARIRLAELVGWKRDDKWGGWTLEIREGRREICRDANLLPDPFTNDNDCMALIGALNKIGYFVYIAFRAGAALVEIKKSDGSFVDDYAGDDYREGIVELAAPIAKEVLSAKR